MSTAAARHTATAALGKAPLSWVQQRLTQGLAAGQAENDAEAEESQVTDTSEHGDPSSMSRQESYRDDPSSSDDSTSEGSNFRTGAQDSGEGGKPEESPGGIASAQPRARR